MEKNRSSTMPLPRKPIRKKTPIQLSQLEQIVKEAKVIDIKNKLKMADKIFKYVKMPLKLVEITPHLLGINCYLYSKLVLKKDTDKSQNFKYIGMNNEANKFTYMDIRELLLEYYTEKHEILKRENLMAKLEERSIRCENDSFNNILKFCGFIWRKLPGTKKCLLIEHPQRVLERQRYFKRLQQYRSKSRPIVYIEEKYYIKNWFDKNTKNLKQGNWCIVVVTENTLIKTDLYRYPTSTENNIYKWFNDDLIPLLPKNSVVVIEERLNCEIDHYRYPDAVNSKEEIKEWLDGNNIPYTDTMIKAELMTLVTKFTKEKCMILEDVLKVHGHDVLRRQKGFLNLSVMTPVTKYLKNSEIHRKFKLDNRFTKKITDTLEACTEQQWKEMLDHVKLEENKIFEEDVLLDEVIDKLTAMTRHEGLVEDHNLDDYQHDLEHYVMEKNDIKPSNNLATMAYNITKNRSYAFEVQDEK